jgi:hypothetical protein
MKPFIIVLFLLGLVTSSYAQDKKGTGEEIKATELPEVVIRSVGKDFSVYLPDKNPDAKVRALQEQFVAYNLGKDYQGYESFLVIMEVDGGSLSATYNENGKLTSVVENYKDVKLPRQVIYSIYKAFPGWEIVNDKFLYSQEDGDIIKKQYNLKIKKDKETKKLVVHPNGEIVSGM